MNGKFNSKNHKESAKPRKSPWGRTINPAPEGEERIPVHIKPERINEYKEELENLKDPDVLKQKRDEKERARQLGDVSDSGDYQAATQDLERHTDRINYLTDLLERAVPLLTPKQNKIVEPGHIVTVHAHGDPSNAVYIYNIIGSYPPQEEFAKSAKETGFQPMSAMAADAYGITGKQVGDSFYKHDEDTKKYRRYTIVNIETPEGNNGE
jgi:transcription elongation GreA/GreB family factor